MKKLLVVLAVLSAFSAHANTHTFTGTIDTPPVAVWVNPTDAIIAPFALYGGRVFYVDPATKYVWSIDTSSLSSTTPTLAAMGGITQTFYTTTNCTGQAYLAVLPTSDFLNFTYPIYRDGLIYVPGTMSNVNNQIQSTWYSGCVSQAPIPATYSMYTLLGPVTAPTLPSGPWHLETR